MFQMETISPGMIDYYCDKENVIIIDLRSRDEYEKSHVKGAVNIPYEAEANYRSLDGKKEYVLYCQRGNASLLVGREMAKRGFVVRAVAGGFTLYRGRNLVICE